MSLLSDIRAELTAHINLPYKHGVKNFFKENVRPLGVRTPVVRRIAQQYFPKGKTKKDVFALCERLLARRTYEETLVAFAWADRMKAQYEENDFARFERWLSQYVDNWAFCDDFCSHAFGVLLFQHPSSVSRVKQWTRSRNRWMRRASAVIFIYSVRRGKYLPQVLDVAQRLLRDTDDLVQKGYGWMLKEASNRFPTKVLSFVLAHKSRMTRTALRYAIEKYPADVRKRVLQK